MKSGEDTRMAKQNRQQASGKGFGGNSKLVKNALSLLSTSDPNIDIAEFDESGQTGMPFWMYNQFEQFLDFNVKKVIHSPSLKSLPQDVSQVVRKFSYLQTFKFCVDSGMGDLVDCIKSPNITDEDLDRIALFDCICLARWQNIGFPMKKTAIDVFNSYL